MDLLSLCWIVLLAVAALPYIYIVAKLVTLGWLRAHEYYYDNMGGPNGSKIKARETEEG